MPEGNDLNDAFFADKSTGWAVGEGGTIIHTTDSGNTWVHQTSGTTEDLSAVFFVDDSIGWIVGRYTTLRTTDMGETWTWIGLGSGTRLCDVFFINSSTGWISGNAGQIYKTTDGGVTWTEDDLQTGKDFHKIFFVDEYNGWAAGGWLGQGIIVHTTDGGFHWEIQRDGGPELHGIHFQNALVGWVVGGGALYKTLDGGQKWIEQATGLGNRSISFVNDTTGWVVGGSGYIHLTRDGGVTWKRQTSNATWELYDVVMNDENNGFIVGQLGIIMSTIDGGTTWVDQYNSITRGTLNDAFFLNQDTGWVSEHTSLFGTTNGGESWTEQQIAPAGPLFSIHFVDGMHGWTVGEFGIIYGTVDGGDTWVQQSFQQFNSMRSVFFVDALRGWACGDLGSIIHTTNGGTTWIGQESGTTEYLYALHFVSDSLGWAVGGLNENVILRTTDGGTIWEHQITDMEESLHGVFFLDSQTGWAVAQHGWIINTTDGGTKWISQRTRSLEWLTDVHFVNADLGWITGHDGEILRTTDGGGIWNTQAGGSANIEAIYPVDANNGWTVGASGSMLHTSTGGSLMVPPMPTYLTSPPNGSEVPTNLTLSWNGVVSATWYTLQVSTSPYFVTSILNRTNITETSYQIEGLQENATYYWRVSLTDSTGTSNWSDVWNFRTQSAFYQPDSVLAFYPLEVGNLWQYHYSYCNCDCQFVTESYHIEEVIGDTTLDTGMIYQIVTSDIPQVVPIRYVRVDSVTANVYRYESGQEWLTDSLLATTGSWFMGDNPTECTDVSIDTVLGVGTIVKRFVEHFVFGADYALGHGFGRTEHNSYNEDPCYPWLYTIERTLVYARIDGEVFGTFVGVAPDENGIPAQFLLEQNYPNPFNPSTTITFSLPRSGEVRLRVFNLLGEEVATLFSGHKDAGTHTVQWDATGQPSGVYFYRLRAGDFTQTRKLVLLR